MLARRRSRRLGAQLFRGKPREDWRRLLAVSAEWPSLAERVFSRLDNLAAAASGEEEVQLLVRAAPEAPGRTQAHAHVSV